MKRATYLVLFLLTAFEISCQKDFLNKRPNQALVVPQTLSDYQALLDNSNAVMNYSPYLPEIATDDIYTPDDGFAGQFNQDQNSYIWGRDIFAGVSGSDWNIPYQQVFYANIVLDGLKTYIPTQSERAQVNQLNGEAYFYRAFAFYNLAQEFAAPYDPVNAAAALGIPLRLESDVTKKSVRASLQDTYQQIIKDLKNAASLLPAQSAYKTRPTKTAVHALLARAYLTMLDYKDAGTEAVTALAANDKLLDYNSLDTTAARPFPASLPNGNPEVLFYSSLIYNGFISGNSVLTSVDTILYQSYAVNDLRKH